MSSASTTITTWRGISESAEATASIGAVVGRWCEAGDVVALIGELGAGKTHFVRGLAEGMGLVADDVSSPTFVLMQEYSGSESRLDLVHIDAYRLEGADDLVSIGWEWGGAELRRGVVTAIEWADRVAEGPEGSWLEIRLEHADATTRRMDLVAHGDWQARMASLAGALNAWHVVPDGNR